VHLGALARRLRLLGVDTAYRNDADDDELVVRAIAEQRTLLTQDRGLLRRRALPSGAYVRGARPDDQVADVLDRFAPPLAPWSRCPACNGVLVAAAGDEVVHLLEPGTRRSYTAGDATLNIGPIQRTGTPGVSTGLNTSSGRPATGAWKVYWTKSPLGPPPSTPGYSPTASTPTTCRPIVSVSSTSAQQVTGYDIVWSLVSRQRAYQPGGAGTISTIFFMRPPSAGRG
jgi:uncharacterized protein with PIN domain